MVAWVFLTLQPAANWLGWNAPHPHVVMQDEGMHVNLNLLSRICVTALLLVCGCAQVQEHQETQTAEQAKPPESAAPASAFRASICVLLLSCRALLASALSTKSTPDRPQRRV